MSMSAPFGPDAELLDTTNAPALLGIVGAFIGAGIITVLLRVYVRSMMLKTFGIDDILIAVSMFCGIGVMVCWVGECANGESHSNQ